MSMVAAGTYIRTLREARHLSRARLAAITGTHQSQIERIERGEQDTRGSLLVAIIHAIQGSLDQIGQLLLDETATAEYGRQLAAAWLTQEEHEELRQRVASVPDDQIAEMLERIKQLRADPVALARLNSQISALVVEQFERDREANKRYRSWLLPRRRKKPRS